jgi:hypothetical protein
VHWWATIGHEGTPIPQFLAILHKEYNVPFNRFSQSLRVLGKVLERDSCFRGLEIPDSFLGDEGTAILCQSIQKNCFLQRVDFRGNNLQRDGGLAIASLIRNSETLQECVLDGI